MTRRDPIEFLETFGSIKRAFSALAAGAYVEAEIGSTQAKFIRVIGTRSKISQAELARATSTDPALTGRALESLIERGWVRRERSEEDRREYVLELSATGKRAQQRVEKLRVQLAAKVVAVLDDRDMEDFQRVANKIVAAFG